MSLFARIFRFTRVTGLFHHCNSCSLSNFPSRSMASVSLLRLVAASVHAANQAGQIVRDVMRLGDLKIVDKTEADRSAQRVIMKCISQNFPTVTVIGEETLPEDGPEDVSVNALLDEDVMKHECPPEWSSVSDARIVVWVDPLDGTSEYTQGFLDHVTVLIGIAVDGKAVAGIICQPFADFQNNPDPKGRTIWALVGLGAFGIRPAKVIGDKLVITTTRSHGSREINQTLEALEPCEVVRVGGAGHKVLLVIEGKAHAYVFPSAGCKKWDTCAPEAVLRANGGILTDILGNDLQYHESVEHVNESGVLAAIDRQIFDKCLRLVPPEVKHKLIPKHNL